MKNRIQVLLVIGVLMLGMLGCGNPKDNTIENEPDAILDNSTHNIEEGIKNEPEEIYVALDTLTNYLTYEDYALADKWASTDDTRIANVMKKAYSGQDITIAVIGGSITEGTIARGSKDSEITSAKPYAEYFKEWWCRRFPNITVNFINAGIGGTDSYLGVHRVEKDVLQYKPDLVLVEFAVNDAADNAHNRSYDNLVRHIMASDTDTACILLFMAQTNGTSAQSKEVFVGFNYNIPMLSYANVMNEFISSGRFTDKDMSGDGVHPSSVGHAITGEILWTYLEEVYKSRNQYGENQEFNFAPVTKVAYENATIINADNIGNNLLSIGDFSESLIDRRFGRGWKLNTGDGSIEIKAVFKGLGILYQSTVDGKSGQFDIFVDGQKVRTINADFKGGWGNAINGTEVYTSEEAMEHTVLIKKAPTSTGNVFNLFGYMISD